MRFTFIGNMTELICWAQQKDVWISGYRAFTGPYRMVYYSATF